MKKIDFCFLTICSKNYISETIGLLRNLQKIYPHKKKYIVSLDKVTQEILTEKCKKICEILTLDNIWEKEYRINIECRMSVAEVAYSSKTAAVHFILKNYSKSVLLLDADLLILEKIDDIISFTKKNSITLTSSNQNLEEWKRTNDTGLFSAGVIGFSESSLNGVAWWKKQCFENTNINIFSGHYNEQKFLDFFLVNYDVKILRDSGINVSSTFLKKIKPFQKKGKWYTNKNNIIRIFHQSRSTDHKIYEKKNEYIKDLTSDYLKKKKSISNSVKVIKIDFIFSFIRLFFARILTFLINFKRIISQKKYGIYHAFVQTFFIKKNLLKKMDREVRRD